MPCYVHITGSYRGMLCIGMTNDLLRRIDQHKRGLMPGFASKYRATRLLFCEMANTAYAAIPGEKEIKGWNREMKVPLIESMNPQWRDLLEDLVRD